MKTNQTEHLVSNHKFGFFFTAVFAAIAAYCYYSGLDKAKIIFASLALVTLASSIFIPNVLSPFNRAWMALGFLLGKIVSPVIMAIIFFVLITPIAVITRLFGRDELQLKPNNRNSYWKSRDTTDIEPSSFKNQF